MRDNQLLRSSSAVGNMLRWAQRLLIVAGAAMLVWCAVVIVDADVAQWSARRSLEASLPPVNRAFSSPTKLPARSRPSPAPVRGTAIAALSIPRVQLSAIVLHGSDTRTLQRGPGHIENTALPGQSGNMAIAGHRDTFFRPLRDVRLGDEIVVDTAEGHFLYRVSALTVVKPHDLSVLEPTARATLTLITCYPFWVLGQAPDRFVVRAVMVTERESQPVAMALPPRLEAPPPPNPTPTVRPGVAANSPVHDDATLVRHAIEQFRLTYNARLASHNDVRPDGPLRFQSCDIEVVDNHGTAACATASSTSGQDEQSVWIVSLARTRDGWAIRSILADSPH